MSRTVGIIAEYNPFHNGHAYLIQKAKELTGADYCAVVMSGDFVQRGAPAIYDKYTRTRMALACGADLVIEMPPVFATSSAEDFAACGIAILDRLGVVDTVCFGSECGSTDPLMETARILCQNPEAYEAVLAENLKNGLTFPQARADALTRYIKAAKERYGSSSTEYDPKALLSSPNNILGAEYCKALIRRNSSIKPLTILRQGDGYHAAELPGKGTDGNTAAKLLGERPDCDTAAKLPGEKPDRDTAAKKDMDSECAESGFREHIVLPSASALRKILSSPDMNHIRAQFTRISHSVPAPVLNLIRDAVPVNPDDFSALLSQRLLQLQLNQTSLTDFLDVSKELAARINRQTLVFSGFEDRASALKTRQYTYTRVSRALTHILLEITEEEAHRRKAGDYISYARILGLRRSAQPLLSAIKKHTQKTAPLPLIAKTADAASLLDSDALEDFRRDLYCSHLYQSVLAVKSGRKIPNEYTASVVAVP